MVITAAVLCLSESKNYFFAKYKQQLVSISDVRSSLSDIKVSYDFTVSIPCPLLHLDLFDLSGSSNNDAKKTINKQRVDINNNPIPKKIFRPGLRRECGSCYGAETPTRKCCYTCEDIIEAYQSKIWSIGSMPNWTQCINDNIKYDGTEKCHVSGTLQINGVEGGFHVAPGINVLNQFGHQHDISPFSGKLNLSHEIDHLTFGDPLEEGNVDHTRVIQTKSGQMHYRYNLKVVPKIIKTRTGLTKNHFIYTVSFAEIPVVERGRFGPGIFFLYDIAPVAILQKPDRPSFAIFVARCVSIIGGAFMLGKLIDSFGYRLNTIEGKMRIGKAE
ncbi:endoplasmic reticulum-Golgi intermediate compartment protein 3-like [Histomonas meleagridis]|uniref:endoplasmic reticulum-Golgi intermediate compartment protein 3-like n=1 Tax=Histomonas meleagridis TaxID=135588 RepID=UPI00355A6664|nr:endoplasmic reticulum-Golgi intermediate compartment protein 3-like [Histomonas meleagridis]KAH0806579.1 endoplasmic reticulum-Golgi intermediate compartment protein 3-like [Histomonas meleagridis]